MSIGPGTRFGPYEVLAAAGAGGMGEVYRARDTRLGRDVAVKVLPAHLSENPALRQRFEREARAASSLNHPHICTLYDIGRENGVDFLVMEYLEGETLAARIEKGALPTNELLRCGVEIADALDKAHRQGLIHRDLKPGNVMLTKSGAKLLDFGLAKTTAVPAGSSGLTATPTRTSPLTAEGTIVGTFQYMAPEQLEGQEADARSDIFAFGAVLYEMATGRTAFSGKTQASLVGSIMKEEPRSIAAVQPMAPPALDRLVRSCLAKDPEERRQSMHDVHLELKWIREGGSQAGVPVAVAARRRGRERIAWAAAVAFALAAAVLGGVSLRLGSRSEKVFRSNLTPPAGGSFFLESIQPGPASISPPGDRVAFVARDGEGKVLLWVRRLDSLEAQSLPGTENASYPFWSPDGRTIGFFANGKLRRVDAGGGPPITLCDAPTGKGGTWNRDGVILFAPAFNTPIHRVGAEGGTAAPVTEMNLPRGDNSHRFPQFLPDGNHFLYLVRSSAPEAGETSAIRIGSLDGKTDTLLMRNQTNAVYATGYLLFVRENTLMAQSFDPGSLGLSGEPTPVAENVRIIGGANRGVFSASENGILVFQSSQAEEGYQLHWLNREGETEGEPLADRAIYGSPRISPDGSRVAVEIFDRGTGNPDLWILDVARGIRSRFTFDASGELGPTWSPDGTELAYASNREGHFDLYRKSFTGTEGEELLWKSDSDKFPQAWSRDGKHIAFQEVQAGTGGIDIWALPLEGTREPVPVVKGDFIEIAASFSPDGKWITYASNESGRFEVYVTPFPGPGRKWQVSTAGGSGSWWSGNGREIIYSTEAGEFFAARVGVVGGSIAIESVNRLFHRPEILEFDASADGSRFLISSSGTDSAPSLLTLVVNWPEELKRR